MTSTCDDALSKSGTLEISQKKEFIGKKIVTYSMSDGKQFGLPENNISADSQVLISSGLERSCRAAVYKNSNQYYFLCRDNEGNFKCDIWLRKAG